MFGSVVVRFFYRQRTGSKNGRRSPLSRAMRAVVTDTARRFSPSIRGSLSAIFPSEDRKPLVSYIVNFGVSR